MNGRWARRASIAGAVTGLVVLAPVQPALAATGPGVLTSVVNANALDRAKGSNFDAVQLTAPAPCDSRATRHVTTIVAVQPTRASDAAAAQKWMGDNLYATASVGLPGPLTVRSNGNWQQIADAFGQQLVPGTYRLELRCQDNLGTRIFQRWRGDVRFSSTTTWVGYTRVQAASGSPSATSSADVAPTATGSAAPSATTSSADATPSSAGTEAAAAVPSSGGEDGGGSGLAATGATVLGYVLLGLVLMLGGWVLVVLTRRRRTAGPSPTTRR